MKEYRSLEDIFSDPDVDELLASNAKKNNKVIDNDVAGFIEITEWVKEHDGKLPQKVREQPERKYYSRLKGIKNNPERAEKLKEYDELGLLIDEDESEYKVLENLSNKSFSKLDDLLSDSDVLDFLGGDDLVKETKLFDTKKINETIKARETKYSPESVARRKKVADFSEYSLMFKEVQKDLASGYRELKKFTNKGDSVVVGSFYVLNGQLIYIESFGEEVDKNNKNGKYKDRRVHVIFENGTESNLLLRGLVASLYGRGGRTVTERDDTFELKNDDYVTGYIYVLKSLSTNPQIADIRNLYKIGFTTTSIKKRLANAENESTYLYAPVKVVAEFQVVNLGAVQLEKAIHHALESYQFDVEITGPNGKMINPHEWFVVDFEIIEEVVNSIVSKLRIEQEIS